MNCYCILEDRGIENQGMQVSIKMTDSGCSMESASGRGPNCLRNWFSWLCLLWVQWSLPTETTSTQCINYSTGLMSEVVGNEVYLL